jgi:hypothetical protein
MLTFATWIVRDFCSLPAERKIRLGLFLLPSIVLLTATLFCYESGWVAASDDGNFGFGGYIADAYTKLSWVYYLFHNGTAAWSSLDALLFALVLTQIIAAILLPAPQMGGRQLCCAAAVEAARLVLRRFLASLFRFLEAARLLAASLSAHSEVEDTEHIPKAKISDLLLFFRLGSATAS